MSSSVSDSIYYYVAGNTSGDYYTGYFYADTGSYYNGWYGSYYTVDNDGGTWGYYITASYDFGYNTGWEGYDTTYGDYYDYDNGTHTG